MEEEDRDKLSAAQGLLDIAYKAGKKSMDDRGAFSSFSPVKQGDPQLQPLKRDPLREARAGSPTRIPAFRSVIPRGPLLNSGRVITSGNAPPPTKPKDESATGFRPPDSRNKEKMFFQPKPRRPEAQERVTLIVSKSSAEDDESAAQPQPVEERDRKASFDLPVPRSAFAAPGRISIDERRTLAENRVSCESIGPRPKLSDLREENEESGSDDENRLKSFRGSTRAQPPSKRSKLDRTLSISTALRHIGNQDKGTPEGAGHSLKTVQELIPGSEHRKRQRDSESAAPVDTMEIAQRLWGAPPNPVHRDPQNIMPRNSSDKSTLEVHKQLAQHFSGENMAHPSFRQGNGEVAERDQGIRQHPSILSAQTLIGSAPLPSDATDELPTPASARALAAEPTQREESQNAAEERTEDNSGFRIWTGQVKHRLKTPTGGTSIAELFKIHAQVPSKLMEQLPPTIFVNVIVSRAQVKLGKHHVANCQLVDPTEEEVQKATALAGRKLVAICELQHCTVTLVPHFTNEQSLRLVAFLISDE